jgi:sulfur-carrier protein
MRLYVQIKLFATLRKFQPLNGDDYPVDSGMTIRDVVDRLGIPIKEAKLIFINGKKGELSTVLHGGERIGIFPPVGGG